MTGLDMAGTADGIKGESRENDNYLLFVQPETPILRRGGLQLRPPWPFTKSCQGSLRSPGPVGAGLW